MESQQSLSEHQDGPKLISDLNATTTGMQDEALLLLKAVLLILSMKLNTFLQKFMAPLPKGIIGIILGLSSITMKGIHILPEVIDSDY